MRYHELCVERRGELTELYFSKYNNLVQSGPFEGLMLPPNPRYAYQDALPKALGGYEAELHPAIYTQVKQPLDTIINVGSAEGYYAVGLARIVKTATIYAYDSNEASHAVCRSSAEENGVGDRVIIAGLCTPEILEERLSVSKNSLVVCDCEGGEAELLDLEAAPSLAKSNIIVECHDFLGTNVTEPLAKRLSKTHRVNHVFEGARNPNAHDFQKSLNNVDRWLTVCEFRAVSMNWIVAEPHQSTSLLHRGVASFPMRLRNSLTRFRPSSK